MTYKVWWQKDDAKGQPYYEFTMSRKRIIRSTSLNLLPISVTIATYTMLHGFSIALSIAIIISGIIAVILCYMIYVRFLNDYYKDVRRYMDSE